MRSVYNLTYYITRAWRYYAKDCQPEKKHVFFAFLNYACYCFLAIYIESIILVHESLL